MSAARKRLGNLTRTAAAIADHFKIPCSKQEIKIWQTWYPAFPMPDVAGCYFEKDCFEWVEKNYLPKFGKVTTEAGQSLATQAQEAQLRSKIRADEDAEFESEVMRGKYIDRKVAQNSYLAFLSEYQEYVRSETETHAPLERKQKLIQLGVSESHVADFHEWDLRTSQESFDRTIHKLKTAENKKV